MYIYMTCICTCTCTVYAYVNLMLNDILCVYINPPPPVVLLLYVLCMSVPEWAVAPHSGYPHSGMCALSELLLGESSHSGCLYVLC